MNLFIAFYMDGKFVTWISYLLFKRKVKKGSDSLMSAGCDDLCQVSAETVISRDNMLSILETWGTFILNLFRSASLISSASLSRNFSLSRLLW